MLHAITASPDVRDQLRTAHLGARACQVKLWPGDSAGGRT